MLLTLRTAAMIGSLVFLGCRGHRFGKVEDVAAMRDSLARIAPLGTATNDAVQALSDAGFRCDSVRMGTFGGPDTIAFSYCNLMVGSLVKRRWQVGLVDSAGTLVETRLTTGLIGP